MEQRAQVGIQCPGCQRRQYMELEIDPQIANSPLGHEIQKHLEEWLFSRCPDHLGDYLKTTRN